MILEFKFRNFRSAKDWQILSFEASADKISEEYYVPLSTIRKY